MAIRSFNIALVLFALFIMAGSAWAAGGEIRGTVKDAGGKIVTQAQIKIERVDAKGQPMVTKTDAKGQYGFRGLGVGTYKLTALVNNVPKSAASIKTRDDGWVKVDFDLKDSATAGKKGKKHYVWVKGEAGTHIGGRWVEVEDGAAEPGQSKVDKVQGQDIRTMQQNQGFHDSSGVTGH
jgi:carboxypeptidase family protein